MTAHTIPPSSEDRSRSEALFDRVFRALGGVRFMRRTGAQLFPRADGVSVRLRKEHQGIGAVRIRFEDNMTFTVLGLALAGQGVTTLRRIDKVAGEKLLPAFLEAAGVA